LDIRGHDVAHRLPPHESLTVEFKSENAVRNDLVEATSAHADGGEPAGVEDDGITGLHAEHQN
jgi:hypothetical protein